MDDMPISDGDNDVPAVGDDLQAEMAQLGAEAEEKSPEEITQAAAIVSSSEEEYLELLTHLLGPGFAVMAPGWGVTTQEVETLAGAYSPLLAKYFPDGPGKFGPEISAALVTVAIIAPRLTMPRQLEKAQESSRQPVKKAANDDAPVSIDAVENAA